MSWGAWDEYGLTLARAVASKSKDPSTQCGCVLLDQQQRVAGTGYNGLPRRVPDEGWLLADREMKLEAVIHAEVNAVLFARVDLTGATAYVWPMPPCSRCAGVLIQAGVVRVVAPRPTTEQARRWAAALRQTDVPSE